MKRFFSFLIAFFLLLASLTPGFSAFAETPKTESLDDFLSALVKVVRTYDQSDSYIAEEFLNTDDDEVDAGLLQETLPIQLEQNAAHVATLVSAQATVQVKNASPVLQISSESGERTVVADSAVRFEDGRVVVPATEVVEALGYSVEATKYGNTMRISNAFQSKRLIVKAKQKPSICGAVACISGYRDLYILQYNTEIQTKEAYAYYQTCPGVEYVEPDYIRVMQADPAEVVAEPQQALSWVSEYIGFESIKNDLVERLLPEFVVAVLDSGVDTDHELFANRLLENSFNLSSTGDANSCEDDYGHGTHVAGILVNNTLSNVKIRPYKILNNCGKGSTSLICLAVDKAVADGANVINMSLSGKGESEMMTESVQNAVQQGVNVVVAAGNDTANLSTTYYSPACIEEAITVSASTQNNQLAVYSNYNGTIDFAAPGENIKSSSLNNTYALMSGTSMAAPLVSAGLAIVRSVYPRKTAAEAEQMLKDYAIQVRERENENRFGSGILFLKYILQIRPKTIEPTFSVEAGEFAESFTLRLSCAEKDATILYVLNSSNALPDISYLNGMEYTEPLTISTDTKVSAIAISKGKLPSSVVSKQYIRGLENEDAKYDIDKNGNITAYYGTDTELVLPATIRGTVVKGVGYQAFMNNKRLRSVTLPDTATEIGSMAFSGCTALESVRGSAIRVVLPYAFQNSSIAEFPFAQVVSIGSKAFSGCNNLQNVDLSNVEAMENSAFENAQNLQILHAEKLKTIGAYAFRGTALEQVYIPSVTYLSNGVFESCTRLRTVQAEQAEKVAQDAFKNCVSLREIQLPKVTSIGKESFSHTALAAIQLESLTTIGQAAFKGCSVLKYAIFPHLLTMDAGAFEDCVQLKGVHFPDLRTLSKQVFSGCLALRHLWLPAVATVNADAFSGSAIQYLQMDVVQTVRSLPATLAQVLFPSTLRTVLATLPTQDFVIYGSRGAYAEQYAQSVQMPFREIPALLHEMPEQFDPAETYLAAFAAGFACTYQWYKTNTGTNVGGEPIAEATNWYFEPTRADNAAAYYCVITCKDGEETHTLTTEAVQNALQLQNADLQAYQAVATRAATIDRVWYSEQSLAKLDAALALSVQDCSLAEQSVVDTQAEEIANALATLAPRCEAGDVNGDGNITAMDVRWMMQALVGMRELDKAQALAADVNADKNTSVLDARWMLQAVAGGRALAPVQLPDLTAQ